MKIDLVRILKGASGFCQAKNCYNRSQYTVDATAKKNDGTTVKIGKHTHLCESCVVKLLNNSSVSNSEQEEQP